MTRPRTLDRDAIAARKPRAGPLLDPSEVIAAALTTVEWKPERKFVDPSDVVVKTILDGLRMAGWKIEPR